MYMVERSYLLKIFMLIIYQLCWKFFMCLIFVGQGYPRKLFNLEHFPIYGSCYEFATVEEYSKWYTSPANGFL